MGRKGIEVVVSELECEQLVSLSCSRSLPHSLVRPAKNVLIAADGHTYEEIAMQCEMTSSALAHWKKGFVADRLAALHDKALPRRQRAHDDEVAAELLAKFVHEKPDGRTHGSVRSPAAQIGTSKSSVARYLSLFGMQSHCSKSFKLPTDPYLVEKIRDIVGLYLSPPHNAPVLWVDETSQCNALEPAQPILPMGLGHIEGMTRDYIRYGTTKLFAECETAMAEVLAQCKPRHPDQKFLVFPTHFDQAVLDVHLIADNYATRKHPKVKAWLAKHPHYHMHFTPTYSSWLHQVERWFGPIPRQAIRRGLLRNARQLIAVSNATLSSTTCTSVRSFGPRPLITSSRGWLGYAISGTKH
jgi:hypothetical protein